MSNGHFSVLEPPASPRDAALVPRLEHQGYEAEQVGRRRAWLEEVTDCRLRHVGCFSLDSERWRGNIENPIGTAQMPVGVAGPLWVRGEHADGIFYVPLATTEGALVRSYERGMVTLTRAGGATTRLLRDENRIAPAFDFADVAAATRFVREIDGLTTGARRAAEATTRHGRLLAIEPIQVGRTVILNFRYSTADAQGMNMISSATDSACRWLVENSSASNYRIFSGYNSEKRASGSLLAGGKGKKVVAGAVIPRRLARTYLHATPEDFAALWHCTVVGHLQAAALGYNGHFANGLTAIFIALGQDVANVANSAVGITEFQVTESGDLAAAVTLPSISVATVGGGTGLGTSAELLRSLGCFGAERAPKLAEIVAATLLAGELSMGAAIASAEFVGAHDALGRNRPEAVR